MDRSPKVEKALRILTLFLIFATLVTFHSWALVILMRKTITQALASPGIGDVYLRRFIYIQFILNFTFAGAITFAVFLLMKMWYGKLDEKLRKLFESAQPFYEKNGIILKPESPLSALSQIQKLMEEIRGENERLKEKLRNLSEEVKSHEKAITTGRLASSLVHEISGPVSALRNYLKAVSGEMSEEKDNVKVYVEGALESLKRIERIIEDLRQVGRAGKPHKVETFKPMDVLERLKVDVRHVHESGVDFRINKQEIEEVTLNGDPDLFYRIIKNLLDNAIKSGEKLERKVNVEVEAGVGKFRELTQDGWYSPEGGYEKLRIPENQDVLSVFVRDNGCGISPAHLQEIFHPFVSYGGGDGSGLGLFIVREGVKSFGGRIFVKTREGEGTEFKIYFPLKASPCT